MNQSGLKTGISIGNDEYKKGIQTLGLELSAIRTHLKVLQLIRKHLENSTDIIRQHAFDYLLFSFRAHVFATLIPLRKLFDERDDSISFKSVVDELKSSGKDISGVKTIYGELQTKVGWYKDFTSKILAHIDKDKGLSNYNPITTPSFDFLDDNKLPSIVTEADTLLAKIQAVAGEKKDYFTEYIGVESELEYMLKILSQAYSQKDRDLEEKIQ